VVYKARDPELERVVALKTVRPDLALPPAARERFHQEARAAGRLSHPGIGSEAPRPAPPPGPSGSER
jgi:serine/threonine protein kinase